MKNKYLVLSGNECGINIDDLILPFVTLEEAEIKYNNYLEEYSCATMFKLEIDKLKLIKSHERF